MEKTKENSKIKNIFFSAKRPINKIANPINRDKNKGITRNNRLAKTSICKSWGYAHYV